MSTRAHETVRASHPYGAVIGSEHGVDPAAVREQLERIVSDSLFTKSVRYPAFLRYVVEHKLDNNVDFLKERVLGMEVFGRGAGYNNSSDPVVRNTASEVRKRLAQYYEQPQHESELRIELPTGSYIPEFHPPVTPQARAEVAADVVAVPAVGNPAGARRGRSINFQLPGLGLSHIVFALAGVIAGAAVPLAFYSRSSGVKGANALRGSALEEFWTPILNSRAPVTISIGTLQDFIGRMQESGRTDQVGAVLARDGPPMVPVANASTLALITAFLGAEGKPYQIRGGHDTTLTELRNGPAVLIGAFNNQWTLRLLKNARFTFERDPETRRGRVKDSQYPSSARWPLPGQNTTGAERDDYAIISRIWDPTTEEMFVVAAGLGGGATVAAGEFLSNPKYMESIPAGAPKNWRKMNMQVVLGTRVINGNSGPPRVLDTYFW